MSVAGEPIAVDLNAMAAAQPVYDAGTGEWLQAISRLDGGFLTSKGPAAWLPHFERRLHGDGRHELSACAPRPSVPGASTATAASHIGHRPARWRPRGPTSMAIRATTCSYDTSTGRWTLMRSRAEGIA